MLDDYALIEIEATNLCNTVCLHCPHCSISRPMGKMTWEVYQAVMDQVKTQSNKILVSFTGMGEPLLNPLIYRFIEYAAPLRTTITTNASALTPDNVERLLQAGLKQVMISFNGHEAVLYETMMGGLSFERIMENIHRTVEMCAGSELAVWANVSVTRQTRGYLRQIRDLLRQAGIPNVIFAQCHNRGGFLKGDLVCDTPPAPAFARCDVFSGNLFVTWNGDVLACCHDLAGEAVFGNLGVDKLDAVLRRRRQEGVRGLNYAICKNCNDLYRLVRDSTPDRRTLSEWIYSLYSDHTPPLPVNSRLSEWLYTLYVAEHHA
jgi:sulfatase maturation enzyme AslB (radical SAM superfamily)